MGKLSVNELQFLIKALVTEALDPKLNPIWQSKNPIAHRNKEREEIEPSGFDEITFISDPTFLFTIKKLHRHFKTFNMMLGELLKINQLGIFDEDIPIYQKILKKLHLITNDISTVNPVIKLTPTTNDLEYSHITEFDPELLPLLKKINLLGIEFMNGATKLIEMTLKRLRHEPKTTSKTAGIEILKLFNSVNVLLEEILNLILTIPDMEVERS